MSTLASFKEKEDLGRRSGGLTGLATVQMTQAHLHGGRDFHPDDYIEGYLLHDLPGSDLVAKQDDEGRPTTLVKLKLKPRDQVKKRKVDRRNEIADYVHGKSMLNAVKPGGGVFMIGNSYLDRKTGIITGVWIEGTIADLDAGNEEIFPGLYTALDTERAGKNGGSSYQSAFVFDTSRAVTFKNGESGFKGVAQDLLTQLQGEQLGTPGLVIRALGKGNENEPIFLGNRLMMRNQQQGSDAWALEPIEQTLRSYLASDSNTVQALRSVDTHWEVIPFHKFGTGPQSLPSQTASKNDDGNLFQYKEQDGYNRTGVTLATSVIRRTKDGTGWIRTFTKPISTRPPLYALEEIPTPNMPEEYLQEALRRASERQERSAFARRPQGEPEEMEFAGEETGMRMTA